MKTINITLKIESEQLQNFEEWLRNQVNVIDLKILPDTEKMYQEDATFKKLVKAEKDAKRVKAIYINDHNQKYLS